MSAAPTSILSDLEKSGIKEKKILSPLKKCLKKLSFKSSTDLAHLADLAYWLYVFGHHKEALSVTQLVDAVVFSGDFEIWSGIENLLLLRARILREQGDKAGGEAARKKVREAMQGHDEAFRRRLSFSWLSGENIARQLAAGNRQSADSYRFSDLPSLLFIRESGTPLNDLDGNPPDIEGAEKLFSEYCQILAGNSPPPDKRPKSPRPRQRK